MHLSKLALPCESGRVKLNAAAQFNAPHRMTDRSSGALCRHRRRPTDFAKRMECVRLAAALEKTLPLRQPRNLSGHSKRYARFVCHLLAFGFASVGTVLPQNCAPVHPAHPAREGAVGNISRKPAEAYGRSRKPKIVFLSHTTTNRALVGATPGFARKNPDEHG